ncbi:unnamed protein product [Victoria cruziana]
MKCNACWRELEGRAVTTTCGHLLCTEDASRILSADGACPVCDQVLSKSLMKPVDLNPNDEWINLVMAGISPQTLMKSAYRSVMFFIGQRELEMQYKMQKMIAQCRQKCEVMQEKFTEKMAQVHAAYQKMAKRCQVMEQEIESLTKDKQELQEKFAEKSRQKRKLDEMYDHLRSEYESMKRSAIQPSGFFRRPEPDFFPSHTGPPPMMDRQDGSLVTPKTPGEREDVWPSSKQKRPSPNPFDVSGGSPPKPPTVRDDTHRRPSRPLFQSAAPNPSATLRNLIFSPMKRPQLSRSNRPPIFT